MKFLEILKNLVKQKPEIDLSPKKIKLEDLNVFLADEINNLNKAQQPVIEEIKTHTNNLNKELIQESATLKNINLNEKKEIEKLKQIVNENLINFTRYLDNLISDLELIKYESLTKLIKDINEIFASFEKRSIKSFEKSTYLIGQELKEVKTSISNFFKNLKTILELNDKLIDKSHSINKIKDYLKNQQEIIFLIKNKNNEISILNKKLKEINEDITIINESIIDIKDSSNYIKLINDKNEHEKNKTRVLIEIQKLKEIIDFKALASAYHSSEKQMIIIKEYKENFTETFEKYPTDKLIELLDIKEINKSLIQEKLSLIKEINDIIENIEISKDETIGLENDKLKYKSKIEDIKRDIIKIEKIKDKIKEDETNINNNIEEELLKINVKIDNI